MADPDTSPDMSAREKLMAIVAEIPVAMVTTVEADGSLRARPMAPERLEDDPDHLYFITSRSSHKIVELSENPHVGLSFAKGAEHASISGRAEILTEPDLIDRLWTEAQRPWFPDGRADKDIAILKVAIDYGEYWDRPGGLAVLAHGWAKAMLTGRSAEGDMGDNAKIGEPG